MPRHTKLLLSALISVTAFVAIAGSATAASFSVSPGGSIESASQGQLTFEPNLFGFGAVNCEVTMNGSLHSGLIEKVEGALVGYITEVIVAEEECDGGTAFVLEEASLPWHIQFVRISGTLPEAVSLVLLRVVNTQFLIDGASDCLYTGDIGGNIDVTRIGAGTYQTDTTLDILPEDQQYTRIIRLGGFFNCPSSPTMEGDFSFTQQTLIRLS